VKRWPASLIVAAFVYVGALIALQLILSLYIGAFPALLAVSILGVALRAVARRYDPR
jgi:hypothetical protein